MQAPIAHDLEKQKTFYHSLMLVGRRRLDKKRSNKEKQKKTENAPLKASLA